jgi:hypothetical protein
MTATKIIVLRCDDAEAEVVEDFFKSYGFSYQIHNSTPVELAAGAHGQMIWNNGEVVVRYTLEHKQVRDYRKGSDAKKSVAAHHLTIHQVINGMEMLPRGYMLGSGSLSFEVDRHE